MRTYKLSFKSVFWGDAFRALLVRNVFGLVCTPSTVPSHDSLTAPAEAKNWPMKPPRRLQYTYILSPVPKSSYRYLYSLRAPLLSFKGAAQFNRNRAYNFGGGLSVEGGDVT